MSLADLTPTGPVDAGAPDVGAGATEVWRRVRTNRLSLVGLALLGAILLAIAVGPLIWDAGPTDQDLSARMAGVSDTHPFGTDTNGRDVLARVLHGGRTSIGLAVVTVAIATVLGGAIGLVSGFARGFLDATVMRVMDIVLSFPALLLALAIAAARGPGLVTTVIAVTVPFIPANARLMRSMVLSVRERDFVLAARSSGIRRSRIMLRHILPNSVTPLVVNAALMIGIVVLEIAGLGFLGLGVQPPHPEWGAMLSDARAYILHRPVVLLAPGLAISLTVIACNLVGDAVRDLLDSR